MKKILFIALTVLMASAAFAETGNVFSGKFTTYWTFPVTDKWNKDSKNAKVDAKFDLAATIDEWNTVKATVKLADALRWNDKFDDDKIGVKLTTLGTDKNPIVAGSTHHIDEKELDNRGNYLRLDSFILTTDITGALGLDLPVAITSKVGDFKFKPVSVANVAPNSVGVVDGTAADGGIGVALTFKVLDMVDISTVFYPKNALEEKAETGVTMKATDLMGMVDVAAFFITSEYNLMADPWNKKNYDMTKTVDVGGKKSYPLKENYKDLDTLDDDKGMNAGFSAAIKPMEGVKFGLGAVYDMSNYNQKSKDDNADDPTKDLKKGVFKAQADVLYSGIDKLNVGFSYGAKDFSAFAAKSRMRFSATYMFSDKLTYFGSIGVNKLKDIKGNDIRYETGLDMGLGALRFVIGGSNDLKFKGDKDDLRHSVFVRFSTSF